MELKEYRDAKSITLAGLAAAVGVTEVAMSRYERGIRFPRPEIIERIEEATDGAVRAEDFLRVRRRRGETP
ncbi:helix-turn-helix domain-containing protein [Azospirillum thermophilum]|uniref:HTH cro/C1-type domain-containing protein n=1 Tax=Azospirillum thermophilum TaxID=2202148 RepID=A0A2S2CKQ5_9PROT|nr:helix-turn-helix transcriptional regulator [Azospirillum thermophilum]AWK85052.1 hypothetical protein DEW08_01610 [Azospirillum thermophilum]